MKGRIVLLTAAVCLLLSGCSLWDGQHLSVTPHRQQRQNAQTDTITASNYVQLREALTEIIAGGTEVAAIHLGSYPESGIEQGIQRAIDHALENDPIGAYAVEEIQYEIGSSSGVPALSVTIAYRHNRSEIQRIRNAEGVERSEKIVAEALEGYENSLVLLLSDYQPRDYAQFAQDYAELHPDLVMETPQVSQNIFGTGKRRVVELIFTYQTSRDSLRRMQTLVKPVFDAAELYVSGDGEPRQKYAQLYAFLMERFDYKQETSITPAYSLLRHGVGDSRAFATVYAAMCRSAGLECLTVTGTRSGEPWSWNMILLEDRYCHVDLLRSSESGGYRAWSDGQMNGYVWDYSEYPACDGSEAPETEEETLAEEISEN